MHGRKHLNPDAPVGNEKPTPDAIWIAFETALRQGDLKLPWDPPYEEYTRVMLQFLEKLGVGWGYAVRREYMRIDLTWHSDSPNTRGIATALEHEISDKVEDVLEEEVLKLGDIKSRLKVLFYYPPLNRVSADLERIGECIAEEEMWIEGERWLVVMGSDSGPGQYRFQAVEFFPDGRWQRIGAADLPIREIRSDRGSISSRRSHPRGPEPR